MTAISASPAVPTIEEAFTDEAAALRLIQQLRSAHGLVGADVTRSGVLEILGDLPDMEEVHELGGVFTTSIVNQVIRDVRTSSDVLVAVEDAVVDVIDDIAQGIRADNNETFTLVFQSGSGTVEIAPWRLVADAVKFANENRGLTLNEILDEASAIEPDELEEQSMLITTLDGNPDTRALSYYLKITRDGDDTVAVLAPHEIVQN